MKEQRTGPDTTCASPVPLTSKPLCGLWLACWFAIGAFGQESITLQEDGSIAIAGRDLSRPKYIVSFGLPRQPAARIWRDGNVLCAVWVTNGIKYTETALVSRIVTKGDDSQGGLSVLLVNIHGENTNGEYTEAAAEMKLLLDSKEQELQLENGLVYQTPGKTNQVFAVLEIPESGIKTPRGTALQFSGSIPPSLSGSMTVKIPMRPLTHENDVLRLRDLEFEAVRRQVSRAHGDSERTDVPVLRLASE